MTRILAAACILCATIFASQAQTPSVRIRGTILALEGNILTVTTREGPVVKITLNEPLTVMTVKKLDPSVVAPGAYIGAAALPGADGALTALEVLVFSEAARGTGEGHFPWDLAPNSSMTNATVAAVVPTPSGAMVTLTPKGSSVHIRVPPDAPIVTPTPAAREDLKPGQAVFISTARAPDGTLSAGRVFVAKDGVAPPM